MLAVGAELPAFVQNRCFARLGWDRKVRSFCRDRRIVYQGFSLLTANPEVLYHPLVVRMAAHGNATPAHVIFRFAHAIGIVPLTGTSNVDHMKQDLASRELALSAEAVLTARGERSGRPIRAMLTPQKSAKLASFSRGKRSPMIFTTGC